MSMSIFMPPSTTIHYKSAFEIESQCDDLSSELRKIIRKWMQKRSDVDDEGRELLSQCWFFLGNQNQTKCGNCYVRTASNIGMYTNSSPEHWAFELLHFDGVYSHRLWGVNIGITKIAVNKVRFSCLLHHGLKSSYIGENPPVPEQTIPVFIKAILENSKFRCYKYNTPITPRLFNVAVFGGAWVAKLITDTSRRLPIIVYAHDKEDVVDFESLVRKNLGNANCYTISDAETLHNFNKNLPYDHHIRNGMLRVYTRFTGEENSGGRHRFYNKEELVDSFEDIKKQITFALSKNSTNFYPNEVYEIKHVIEKRRLSLIQDMRENSASRDDKEYIALLEKELDEKQKEINFWEKELELASDQIQEMMWKSSQYSELLQKINDLERTLRAGQKEFDIPQTLDDVLTLAQIIWGERIAIHALATKSAKNYAYCNDPKIIHESWMMLNKLATIMYKLKFIDNSNDLQATFTAISGIAFSMTESKTTKRNKLWTSIRKCIWQGEEYEFFPHLKGNVRSDFRIHFAFVENDKKILICHFGEHLSNAKTQYL